VILPEGVKPDRYFAGTLGEESFPQSYVGIAAKTEPPVVTELRGFYQRPAVFTDVDRPEDRSRWVTIVLRGVGPVVGAGSGAVLERGQAELGSDAAGRLKDRMAGGQLVIPYQGVTAGPAAAPAVPPHLRRGPLAAGPTRGPVTVRVRAVRPRTGTIKDHMVFVDLDVARRLYGIPEKGAGEGPINVVEGKAVLTGGRNAGAAAVQALRSQFAQETPGVGVHLLRGVAEGRRRAVESRSRRMGFVAFGVFVFGALVVGGFAVLNVRRRRNEMGILLAVAARPPHVRRMFLEKMLILAVAGGVIGCMAGELAAVHWGPAIEPFDAGAWGIYGLALAVALVVTLLPSLAGVFVASHVDPADTVRGL